MMYSNKVDSTIFDYLSSLKIDVYCNPLPVTAVSWKNTISYPLFVHAIRENIYGLGSYHTRLKAECDTNPNH